MIRLYINENFPQKVVELLRDRGYDVLTTKDAGKSGVGIPDEAVLSFAVQENRALITINRKDFIRLHKINPEHTGIIVCTENHDLEQFVHHIHAKICALTQEELSGQLLRVYRG
jgi:predicted nuclease of predicted toxin-antitoxin system